jgi:hypothetical protein
MYAFESDLACDLHLVIRNHEQAKKLGGDLKTNGVTVLSIELVPEHVFKRDRFKRDPRNFVEEDEGDDKDEELPSVDEWIVAIADGLRTCTSLRSLSFHGGGRVKVDESGRRAIAETLASVHSLKWLSVQGLVDFGVDLSGLAGTLEGADSSLLELKLNGCNVENDGSAALARALKTNVSLRRLTLDADWEIDRFYDDHYQDNDLFMLRDPGPEEQNRICDDGAEAFAEALENNKSLITLSIKGGIFTERGLVALGKALQVNNTLQELDIEDFFVDRFYNTRDYGRVGEAAANALGEALASNTSLKYLSLGEGGRFTRSAEKIIGRGWGANWALVDMSFQNMRTHSDHDWIAESAYEVRRKDKLAAFAMCMVPRLGQGVSEAGQDAARAASPFHRLVPEVFKIIGSFYPIKYYRDPDEVWRGFKSAALLRKEAEDRETEGGRPETPSSDEDLSDFYDEEGYSDEEGYGYPVLYYPWESGQEEENGGEGEGEGEAGGDAMPLPGDASL